MDKFNVIIPARMHSSRLNQKMVQLIGDLPLIVMTAKQVEKSRASQVIVATDHNEIMDICNKYNIKAVMTSDTHNSGTERIHEACQKLEFKNDEIIINVQGDEPFIEPSLINELAKFMQKRSFATVAHPINTKEEICNPNVVKVVLDHKQNALYFSRATIPYYRDGFNSDSFTLPSTLSILRHIGIYGYTVDFLKQYVNLKPTHLEQIEALEQLRPLYYGHKIAVLTTKLKLESGIDTIEDLNRARNKIQ